MEKVTYFCKLIHTSADMCPGKGGLQKQKQAVLKPKSKMDYFSFPKLEQSALWKEILWDYQEGDHFKRAALMDI